MARGPQETTRLVRGGPLVTIILSNRNISKHNNGGYKTHDRYNKKSKTFVLNDCNKKSKLLSLVENSKFFWALKQDSIFFGIGSAGMRRKLREVVVL